MLKRLDSIEEENSNEVIEVLKTSRETLDTSTKKLQKHLHKRTDSRLQKLLTSIPGVGPTIADILIAEIGNIDRFHFGSPLLHLLVLIQELNKVVFHLSETQELLNVDHYTFGISFILQQL